MDELSGEGVLIRVFVGESERYNGKPSYQALVEMLRSERISGATVLRGIMGYGAHSHPRTAGILRLSMDLPVVIEAVDTRENIERVLPKIQEMFSHGLITTEKVGILRYGAAKKQG